jgi:hypothetical protein
MTTYLQTRWGGSGKDPSESELQAALAELATPDPEHPDCWLIDENGWSISAFDTGLVVFENVETDEGPWHMPNCTSKLMLALWNHLKAGELDKVKTHAWREGYSS